MSVLLVAELGINHGGDYDRARAMIEAAAACGADAVKLQSYRTGDFLPPGHPQYELFERCEIWRSLGPLVALARTLGLRAGTTPTSTAGVKEAVAAGCDFLKNGSDFLLRHDLIEAMAKTGLPTVLSTGMATEEEVEAAVCAYRSASVGAPLLTVLACTSVYPCPDDEANLRRIPAFANLYPDCEIGYSDHTLGLDAACGAAWLGARMIEKHFTIDKKLDGPDHYFSANPGELRRLVAALRKIEELRGSPEQVPTASEEYGRAHRRVREGALRSG